MNKSLRTFLLVAFALTPFIYLGMVYAQIPEIIPTHYNIKNEPDRLSKKTALWTIMSVLMLVSLGNYLLLANAKRLDPKKSQNFSEAAARGLGIFMLIIFTLINYNIVLHTLYPNINFIAKLHVFILGLLWSGIGQFMRKADSQSSLSLLGNSWLIGGLIIIGAGVLAPLNMTNIIMMIVMAITAILTPLILVISLTGKKRPGTK
jgi:uncharacterized membrane protein